MTAMFQDRSLPAELLTYYLSLLSDKNGHKDSRVVVVKIDDTMTLSLNIWEVHIS